MIAGERHHGGAWTAEQVRVADCVVLLTAHRRFLDEPLWRDARLLVDTRNVSPAAPGVWVL